MKPSHSVCGRRAIDHGHGPGKPTASRALCCVLRAGAWLDNTIRVAGAFALAVGMVTAMPANAEDFTKIPTIVNLLKNSGATEANARKAIEEANKILKQSNLMLNVIKVNKDVTDGGNDDGEITAAEDREVTKNGEKEIEATKNKRGLKINFAKVPYLPTPTSPGVSEHRLPVLSVKERQDGAAFSATLTGETIAHEIGHALTLGPKHVIDPPKAQAGPPVVADAGGHAGTASAQPPNLAGNLGTGNLMAPSDIRKGTALTKRQIEEIQGGGMLGRVGKTIEKEKKQEGERRKEQHGTKADDLDDQSGNSAPHMDLSWTSLTSIVSAAKINVFQTLAGLFPASGPVNAVYRFLFDTDADGSTGLTLASFPSVGFEREVRISVSGDASIAPLSIVGTVFNPLTNAVIGGVTNLALLLGEKLFDIDSVAVPNDNQIEFDVDKALLGLTAADIPVGVVTTDGVTPLVDMAGFIFDTQQWLKDPVLRLFDGEVFAGDIVSYTISGLLANSPYDLLLDSNLLVSGMLDSFGAASGSFSLPGVAGNTSYFVSAHDATGEFAFNVLFVSEPGGLVLVLVGLAGLFATRRRR